MRRWTTRSMVLFALLAAAGLVGSCSGESDHDTQDTSGTTGEAAGDPQGGSEETGAEPASPPGRQGIVAPGAAVVELGRGFRFTEGPVADARGGVYFYEVTQIKGDGEAHPLLSPTDEFADFETWDEGNLNLTPKQPDMIKYEYAREAFKNGLMLEKRLGANPFKFGLASGTDTHTALSTAEEDNFFGKHSGVEPSPERWEHVTLSFDGREILGWRMAAAGYTAVWAAENTREAIWDAMHRRETYSSTGPRMTVWFFGGWEFTPEDAEAREPGWVGYDRGVPMGGELEARPGGKKAPTFLVAALRDPIGANLDRVQIVKGWVDAEGKTHERIYDVAVSGGRTIDASGRCKTPVGNTVDVPNATWRNSIGSPEMITVWEDPDFDASVPCFYYARILQIPTPRWTAYEAKRFKIELPPEVPMTVQERAYTSPIWYTP